jgi:hypothetical protein
MRNFVLVLYQILLLPLALQAFVGFGFLKQITPSFFKGYQIEEKKIGMDWK